ncbi:hypothetical protein AA0482_0353 [Acetobacter cibinongensis NRIC 0482]|nr:hypothetical protein AA0482_0353 [Acetobacter cibinongensis NRIC 0482]
MADREGQHDLTGDKADKRNGGCPEISWNTALCSVDEQSLYYSTYSNQAKTDNTGPGALLPYSQRGHRG